MVSVMLYPCILCVSLCLGVVAILLLNVMDVISVGGGDIYRDIHLKRRHQQKYILKRRHQ